MNSSHAAAYAMQVLQQQMASEAAGAGLGGPGDVDALVSDMRAES